MKKDQRMVGIIPARLKSKRFPNKLFAEFLGKPIIHHVISNALKLNFLNKIVVVTDSDEIIKYVNKTFVEVDAINVGEASCGSERSYLYYKLNKEFDYYISIPSDEPYINPYEVNSVVSKIDFRTHIISSFYSEFYCIEDLVSPLSCKIVIYDNMMIYNSRNVIPIRKNGELLPLKEYNKHVGIFVFPKDLLGIKEHLLWSKNSDVESLEQNRFVELNVPVRMYKMRHIGFGIDSRDQIEILEGRVNEENNRVNDDDRRRKESVV